MFYRWLIVMVFVGYCAATATVEERLRSVEQDLVKKRLTLSILGEDLKVWPVYSPPQNDFQGEVMQQRYNLLQLQVKYLSEQRDVLAHTLARLKIIWQPIAKEIERVEQDKRAAAKIRDSFIAIYKNQLEKSKHLLSEVRANMAKKNLL